MGKSLIPQDEKSQKQRAAPPCRGAMPRDTTNAGADHETWKIDGDMMGYTDGI